MKNKVTPKLTEYVTKVVSAECVMQRGFTLIELLIVVAIIATLAVSVFVALNPAQRLKDSKNARRTSDVDTILTAIHTSIVDDKGALPTNLNAIGTNERQIGTGDATACATALTTMGCNTPASTACVDLISGTQNLQSYLKSMPIDPGNSTTTFSAAKTGYSVQVDSNGLVTVRACGAEGTTNIFSSR
jgi:prepilin-type N-terminal cleavage/methylation domain-containing protein